MFQTKVGQKIKTHILSSVIFSENCDVNDIHSYLLTYLLTPWSRVLLEKLTVYQLFKKFPAFYGTRRFITAFTSARHLSHPEPDQSSPYPHTKSNFYLANSLAAAVREPDL